MNFHRFLNQVQRIFYQKDTNLKFTESHFVQTPQIVNKKTSLQTICSYFKYLTLGFMCQLSQVVKKSREVKMLKFTDIYLYNIFVFLADLPY